LSKIKEKKLNLIKSEIKEIKKYISSDNTLDISKENYTDNFNNKVDDTLTLTNIVKEQNKLINNNDLEDIKKELKDIKCVIDDNKNLLKEILLKIK
tara:strand:- start:28 stop:315 length:288 start_codon:yes stop_codon:yes gene_type:complete